MGLNQSINQYVFDNNNNQQKIHKRKCSLNYIQNALRKCKYCVENSLLFSTEEEKKGQIFNVYSYIKAFQKKRTGIVSYFDTIV